MISNRNAYASSWSSMISPHSPHPDPDPCVSASDDVVNAANLYNNSDESSASEVTATSCQSDDSLHESSSSEAMTPSCQSEEDEDDIGPLTKESRTWRSYMDRKKADIKSLDYALKQKQTEVSSVHNDLQTKKDQLESLKSVEQETMRLVKSVERQTMQLKVDREMFEAEKKTFRESRMRLEAETNTAASEKASLKRELESLLRTGPGSLSRDEHVTPPKRKRVTKVAKAKLPKAKSKVVK